MSFKKKGIKSLVYLEGEPTPYGSEFKTADVIIKIKKTGELEIQKSLYPEVREGTYRKGENRDDDE